MERRDQILSWLKDILRKNLQGVSYRAFVFGSQANKPALIRADIDVGIITDDIISTQHLAQINADIEELPMLFNVDVVDFNQVAPQFRSVALQNVEML